MAQMGGPFGPGSPAEFCGLVLNVEHLDAVAGLGLDVVRGFLMVTERQERLGARLRASPPVLSRTTVGLGRVRREMMCLLDLVVWGAGTAGG